MFVYLRSKEVYCKGILRRVWIFVPWTLPRNLMSPHEVQSQWLLRHITKSFSVWYVMSLYYVSMIYLYSTAKILNIMNIILSGLSNMQNVCSSPNFIMPKRASIKYYHFQYFCFTCPGCTSDTLSTIAPATFCNININCIQYKNFILQICNTSLCPGNKPTVITTHIQRI